MADIAWRIIELLTAALVALLVYLVKQGLKRTGVLEDTMREKVLPVIDGCKNCKGGLEDKIRSYHDQDMSREKVIEKLAESVTRRLDEKLDGLQKGMDRLLNGERKK